MPRIRATVLSIIATLHLVVAFLVAGHGSRKSDAQQRENHLATWDCTAGERVLWRVKTGGFNGMPVVSQGRILLGSNYAAPHNPKIAGPRGVMSCFLTKTGELLWQATHEQLPI